MIVPTRKTASSWADVAKTNPVSQGLTQLQSWAIFNWEAAVADAIVNGSLRQFGGKGVPLAIQNEAIEIFTRNLFRLRGRGADQSMLRKIMESLITKGQPYKMDHWFVSPALETPVGWPYYIPSIQGRGKVKVKTPHFMDDKVVVGRNHPAFPKGSKAQLVAVPLSKAWADLDDHPALKG